MCVEVLSISFMTTSILGVYDEDLHPYSVSVKIQVSTSIHHVLTTLPLSEYFSFDIQNVRDYMYGLQ